MKRGDSFALAIGKLCWARLPGRIGGWDSLLVLAEYVHLTVIQSILRTALSTSLERQPAR